MRQHTDTYPRIDYTDEALTMSNNTSAEKSKRKRKSKNTEVPNTATASQKRINPAKLSTTYDRRHTAIRFSSLLVTKCTETGEKGENRSNIIDNNLPTQTNQIKKLWKFRWAGRSATKMKETATTIPLKKKTATTSRYRTTISQ